jgi:DNA-binding NarL/FixJ family response regulator
VIRVLIVDDHPLVARGVEATLQSESDIEVVGIAGTAQEAEEIAKGEAPDVVMMDFRLPDRSGAEAAAAIRSERPEIAVVFLTGDVSDDAIGRAVQSGAVGFLLKGDAPNELAPSIRRAAAGEMLIPADVLAKLLMSQRRIALTQAERAKGIPTFTPRELDVLRLMGQGIESGGIAERLFVELTTVRWHVGHILDKLSVHSKLAAVLRASELGLLER